MPLPSRLRVLWLRCSGPQASCHSIKVAVKEVCCAVENSVSEAMIIFTGDFGIRRLESLGSITRELLSEA